MNKKLHNSIEKRLSTFKTEKHAKHLVACHQNFIVFFAVVFCIKNIYVDDIIPYFCEFYDAYKLVTIGTYFNEAALKKTTEIDLV